MCMRLIGSIVLAFFIAVSTLGDAPNSQAGASGGGCPINGCVPTASWFTTTFAPVTLTTTNWVGMASLVCHDDLVANPLAIFAEATASSGNIQPQAGQMALSNQAVVGPNNITTAVSSSGHDLPSCIPVGNGYSAIYTHGVSGNESCISVSGGSGSAEHCSDVFIGNTVTSLCNGTALVDICNASSERPLPIGGALGGPLSEGYGVCLNVFGNNQCIIGGQEQTNTSFSGGMAGSWVYMSYNGNMPTGLTADVGVPGGAATTYDVINGTITATGGQGLQMAAMPGHDDNVYSIDFTGDTLANPGAGAEVLTLPATRSFGGCTASSAAFTSQGSKTLDVQKLNTDFNAGSWTGTGCSGYQSFYALQLIASPNSNRANRGCITADLGSCQDLLLVHGNPAGLAGTSAPTCAAPFTCTNLINTGFAATNHDNYQFCRTLPILRSLVTLCTNTYSGGGYQANTLAGASSIGQNYSIYRSPGRGVSVPNASPACNVSASQKYCWCDWWYSKCTASTGVDATTFGTSGPSPVVLGGGPGSTGGTCTVGSWPTCAGGNPTVCTTDSSCSFTSTYFVPNPTAGNDIGNAQPFSFDYSEGQIPTTSPNTFCLSHAPATNDVNITQDPVSGAGWMVYDTCDSTTSGTATWNIYLLKLDPVCCTADLRIKVAQIGSSASFVQGLPVITFNSAGHIHIWFGDWDGGVWCSLVGLCVKEFSVSNGYPITSATTFSATTVYNAFASAANSASSPCERSTREEYNSQYTIMGCMKDTGAANGSETVLVFPLIDNT